MKEENLIVRIIRQKKYSSYLGEISPAMPNEINAIVLLKENEHPIVHSDRGCHYRWSGWIQRMDEADLTRSMSQKGCSPDNSACEGFFGRMKNEMFYGEKWDKISLEEFISIINQYMQWYRDKRIKLSLGGLSPMEYRRSLGIA